MKDLVLQDIRLLSRRERSAHAVTFHPKATVIRGANDTGKSSLIKSIYWCFGAEPAKTNDVWSDLDICAVVRFTLANTSYQLLRYGRRTFGLFTGDGRLLQTFASVTKDLGPYLSNLLGFKLVLNDREGRPSIPPPAYFFLPFYMDQDRSWIELWSSFSGLQQYPKWRKDVAEYHIGLFPNTYYERKSRLVEIEAALDEPRRRRVALQGIVEQVKKRISAVPFDFDLDRFRAEVAQLVTESGELQRQEDAYRSKVGELANRRAYLVNEGELARKALAELSKDYTEAVELPTNIECPTCGAHYDNSIIERFRLVLDQDACEALINDVAAQRRDIEAQLAHESQKLADLRKEHARVWELLATKREALTLHDVIKSEARGETVRIVEAEIGVVTDELAKAGAQLDTLRAQLSQFQSKERRQEFREKFVALLGRFSAALSVPMPKFKTFAGAVAETGSDGPRAVLAYQFAFLHMIAAHSESARAPVVIDSPNQQDQDPVNHVRMLEFIRDKVPDHTQLILGLVDSEGVKFPGKEHILNRKRQLLSADDYRTTGIDVERLLAAVIESDAS